MAAPPKETAGASVEPAARLLERDAELGRLNELIEATAQGRGGAAAIVGPAGIGKTSLLAAARELARQRGSRVLSARGGELERDFAFGVARQLFEPPLRRLSARERDSALEGAAAHAAPAIGIGVTPEADPGDSSFAVVHGLYWLCVNLAEQEPLVILVDDSHWADAASLRFLSYLARRVDELPLLVLTSARPTVETGNAELVASLTSDPGATRIAPSALSADAVGELLAAKLSATPEPAFVSACHEATAGNPFLCATLAAALAEGGIRPVAGAAAQVAEVSGGAVSARIVRRLGRLPVEALAVARAVAILGADVELRHAATLAGLEEARAAAGAAALMAHGILAPGATLEFVHPLVRSAIREEIAGVEQALLHRRAARLLDGDGVPPERTAIHLLATEPARESWAVERLRAAGHDAASKGDPGAAAAYLRRALREPPGPAARPAILHDLGLAELHAGEPGPAAEHLREAHRLTGDPLRRAGIARDLSVVLRAPGRYEEGTALLAGTIAEVTDLDPDLALALAAELHQSATMQLRTYAVGRDALNRTSPDVEGATRGERALLAAWATEGSLRTEGAAAVRERALRAFDRGLLADQSASFALWINAAFPLIFADGLAEAARVCAAATEDARLRGSPVGSARAHTVVALLRLREGAVRSAEAEARAATELGLAAGFRGSLLAIGVLVETLVERGELDAADDELRNAEMDEEIPELFVANWVLQARGRLRLAQGRAAEAIADFDELARRGEQGWRPWNPAMLAYRSGLALALIRIEERERARKAAEGELELARRWGTPRGIGASLRTLGQVTGRERGVELLRQSVETLDGAGAPLELAHSLVELGTATAAAGRRADAREPLHAGMELAHRCGAAALTERGREQLVATGARPRRILRTGIEALTPSELRVARMAAGGMTNREIAQALFVTLRTVQVHLTHTYRKLDIASREELPGALAG